MSIHIEQNWRKEWVCMCQLTQCKFICINSHWDKSKKQLNLYTSIHMWTYNYISHINLVTGSLNNGNVNVSLKLLGLISCENLWLLIARHSVLRERGANDQVIRSLALLKESRKESSWQRSKISVQEISKNLSGNLKI